MLTSKHIYFQGQDKERFRVRLDKLVSAETAADGFLFQRDGVRARPEAFGSYDARVLAVLLDWLEDPEAVPGGRSDVAFGGPSSFLGCTSSRSWNPSPLTSKCVCPLTDV